MFAVIFTMAEFFCWLSSYFLFLGTYVIIPIPKINVSDIHLMQDINMIKVNEELKLKEISTLNLKKKK